jgi:hypothetical protein
MFVYFRSSSVKFIDVWPVNFFQPDDEDPFDTTSLFMLQLACIINMVSCAGCLPLAVSALPLSSSLHFTLKIRPLLILLSFSLMRPTLAKGPF